MTTVHNVSGSFTNEIFTSEQFFQVALSPWCGADVVLNMTSIIIWHSKSAPRLTEVEGLWALKRQTVIWRLWCLLKWAHFQSLRTHTNSPNAMAFMCAGRGLTAGSRFMWNSVRIKRVCMVSSRPACKLESYGETVNITHTYLVQKKGV